MNNLGYPLEPMVCKMKRGEIADKFILALKMGIFPVLFYLLCFFILTYPLLLSFSSHFFCDRNDGLQNAWNIWWVNQALTRLGQSPWHTSYLHYPGGATLLGHTLNPFNGFLGIILLKFLSLPETYNFIVIFSFAAGGLTAFFLAYYLTGFYWGSIVAGFIFTFSNYHFSHARGHLQLVSLEWIPLFLLSWFALLAGPGMVKALIAALALFLVALCDYYYLFYCLLTAVIIFAWHAIRTRNASFFLRKEYLKPLLLFLAAALATTGVLLISLLLAHRRDPFIYPHPAREFSLDLLAPLVYGGNWRFARLTEFYWSKLPGNISESSVYLGLSVTGLLIYVWVKRRSRAVKGIGLWYFIFFFFLVMALGPVLHVGGVEIPFLKLPYQLLILALPPLRLSGLPVRMMIMPVLSAAIICAFGGKILSGKAKKNRWLRLIIPGFLILLFIEYLPRNLPRTRVSPPRYVNFLKDLPGKKGVIDKIARPAEALFYQTIHQKPLAFGYISRRTRDLKRNSKIIKKLIREENFSALQDEFYFQYLVVKADRNIDPAHPNLELIYRDEQAKIFELKPDSLSSPEE